jgi:hypothetical protein
MGTLAVPLFSSATSMEAGKVIPAATCFRKLLLFALVMIVLASERKPIQWWIHLDIVVPRPMSYDVVDDGQRIR